MLLIHQTGTLRVGEVNRYTITYTPSQDRILPIPKKLFVRVRNNAALPLRAAYLHGPYTLYTACFPATFDPSRKVDDPEGEGTPQFESNLKAGGSWGGELFIPDRVRKDGGKDGLSVTWIVEVASQIIFSASAQVHFELSVGRDEKSLNLGIVGAVGPDNHAPDRQSSGSKESRQLAARKGVYSRSIQLQVENTSDLWNKPELPKPSNPSSKPKSSPPLASSNQTRPPFFRRRSSQASTASRSAPPKKIHLVIITHGLHSNTGADMLYLKESIDATAAQARANAKVRKAAEEASNPENAEDSASNSIDNLNDDEEVIVRGFRGNAARTERGIKYLGKRVARYVLSLTYPTQPFLPIKKSSTMSMSFPFFGSTTSSKSSDSTLPAHPHSSVQRQDSELSNLPYKITSISFVGHSLGGLVQTYAIGYIQKHSPTFFDEIKPINFIAMASPFLGLSNENPIYVKFALDSGLVGRTGKDLGLTWRAPNIARSGWDAMLGGMGSASARKNAEEDPEAKPLLRILPTGPAYHVLRKFRNRTVYSNVVNDGIVPLRTSCLLFLDWKGLDRVDKARRENGLVGTMVEWGWAEMMGGNTPALQRRKTSGPFGEPISSNASGDEGSNDRKGSAERSKVPQPSESATKEDTEEQAPASNQFLHRPTSKGQTSLSSADHQDTDDPQKSSTFGGFWDFFLPRRNKSQQTSPKSTKIYKRSQTVQINGDATSKRPASGLDGAEPFTLTVTDDSPSKKSDKSNAESVFAPPRTTVFESAGDILSPPLPTVEFITDPGSRPRTIFHDRVYHADDIPSPPVKARPSSGRSHSSQSEASTSKPGTSHGPPTTPSSIDSTDSSGMKVEERIARAYHRDIAWRKVLVRLEPDAHNNIVVRRQFSNAQGWAVVSHLCETHFADTYVARTKDDDETGRERTVPLEQPLSKTGEEVSSDDPDPVLNRADSHTPKPKRTDSELKEALDSVASLRPPAASASHSSSRSQREDSGSVSGSGQWSDHYFEVTDDEDDDSSFNSRPQSPTSRAKARNVRKLDIADDPGVDPDAPRGTSEAEIAAFLTASPVKKEEGFQRL